jgi:transposase
MLRLVLEEYLALGRMRESIAQQAEIILASNPDRRRLMTVPGVGPLTALTILAEAGDLRRFAHYRQFLKFCGMVACSPERRNRPLPAPLKTPSTNTG